MMSLPRSLHSDHDIRTTNTSPARSTMDTNQIITFFKKYIVLECSCCSEIFGFQHKASGLLYCLDGCHERTPPPSPPMTHSPNMMGGTVTPPATVINRATPTTMMSDGPNKTAAGVANRLLNYSLSSIMPIAAGVPPTAEAVHPISSPKVVADPPLQEKAKVQEAAPMSAKVSSSVQQSITEKVLVTPPPPQNVPVTEKVRTAPSAPKNVPVTEKVRTAPPRPKTMKTTVHVLASMTNVIQGSVDVPDARISEPKPTPTVVVSVKHNPNVALSRARIPWPEYQRSESVKCTIVFDCGDGGFFLQSKDPRVVESVNSVGEGIVNFIRSGKCKSLAKPAMGALCLAPFEGEYYRAEIIAEEAEGKWRTFFIDYGNTDILSSGDLFILPDELKREPRLCVLGYWDQVLAGHKKSDELYNICQIENFPTPVKFLKKITDGQYIVQIGEAAKANFEVEIPLSIPVQVQSPPQWADCIFSPNLLSNESVVRIIYGWDTLTYHVMAEADEESAIKFQTLIAEYASEAEPLTRSPSLGEIVVAPYDGLYYRGKVDKVEGDNCTCTFVDYGDSKVIKISDIKPINDAIMKYPVYGMKVRLAKVPDLPEGFIMDDRLDDLIYAWGYYLDLKQKGAIKPADVPHFDAWLWDLQKENVLNEAIETAIAKCLSISS